MNVKHPSLIVSALARCAVRRCVLLWSILVAATLLSAPAANAFTIGPGSRPGVAVDASGTAYIAYNGPEVQNVAPLRFCRLPRGATACDAGAASSIVTPGNSNSLSKPFIVVSGERVVIVQYRYGDGVPGTSALLAYTSTNRGASFGPGRVVGKTNFEEAVVGPGDTMSGATNAGTGELEFQNVPLDGTAPVDANGKSTVPWAVLSTTHPYQGTVGLVDANTPVTVFTNGSDDAQFRRYDGSGDLNAASNWTAPVDIGSTRSPHLAGGPSGLFLLGRDPQGSSFVRRFDGTSFGPAVNIGPSSVMQHLIQDGAGRLHAVFSRGGPTGQDLVHAVSDNGTAWRTHTVVTQTLGDGSGGFFDHLRVAAAADHHGVAVWRAGDGIRVATIGPDTPGAVVPPPPPPVAPRPPAPVLKAKPSLTVSGLARRAGRRYGINIKGRLVLPAGVSAAKGCNGTVRASIRRATRMIAAKTVMVKPSCAYVFSSTVTRARVGRSKKLAIRIRFTGNNALAPVTKVGWIKVKR